jgi:CelD/BcsL family acetyltransferase involved in cellulose biosynthesis
MPEAAAIIGADRWPMAVWRPLPGLAVLHAPVVPRQDLNGSPVGEGEATARNLRSVVDEVRASATLPKVIVVKSMAAEGPAWDALQRLEAQGMVAVTPVLTWRRAMLFRSSAPDAEAYLGQALSSSTRKSLRRKRKALEEAGALRLEVGTSAAEIAAGFDVFTRLEATGWKGRNGTALAQEPVSAAHVRETLRARADGRAFTVTLHAGERPVAAGLFLRDGGEVGFWKTAYDEALAKQSPGVILDVMLTEWLFRQPWFERLDAGHDDSVDPATLIWAERREMAMIVIDLRPGSPKGRVVAGVLRLRQKLRAWRNSCQAAK